MAATSASPYAERPAALPPRPRRRALTRARLWECRRASRCGPRGRGASPRMGEWTGSCAIGRECSNGCCTEGRSRWWCASPRRPPTASCSGRGRAPRGRRSMGSSGCASRWAWTRSLRAFHTRFARDPLIGASVRRRPWLRVRRRPEPWEALAWAVCEQLIEFERAAAIERRIVARLGRRESREGGEGGELRDVPTPKALAGVAPALLQSLDLGGARARTLVRVAREVARGRIDLHSHDHERTWRRLRAIPGIGPWTVEMLALHGQGRHDQVPAGDVGPAEAGGASIERRRPVRACTGEGGPRILHPLRRVGRPGRGAHDGPVDVCPVGPSASRPRYASRAQFGLSPSARSHPFDDRRRVCHDLDPGHSAGRGPREGGDVKP